MKTPQSHRDAPEIASFTRYYEHDGMLRAYANRAMFLAILFAVIALSSLGFAIYVRIQPPTVIRVDKDGNAVVVGGGARQDRTAQMAMVLSAQAAGADATASEGVAPTDLEGKAVVRRFLEHYLSYTPDSAPRNLAESLNMMTNNLRTFTLNKLRDDDTVGKIVGRPHHLGSPNSLDRAHQEWAVGLRRVRGQGSAQGEKRCGSDRPHRWSVQHPAG